MRDILEALRPEFETVKTVLDRAEVSGPEWNTVTKSLHDSAKGGQCLRRQTPRGWEFAKVGTVEELPPEPVETSGLPEWAQYPVWDPSKGPSEGVFDNRPAGEHCLWSVRWNGVPPELQKPPHILESQGIAATWFELRDCAQRQCEQSAAAAAIVMQTSADPSDEAWARWGGDADKVLRAARQGYPDCTPPWDIGPRVRYPRWRKGWEGPFIKELERRLDGVWYWKGIALSRAYEPPKISRQHEARAEAAVREANKAKWGGR